MQLAYQLSPPPGSPGLLYDNERGNADIVQVCTGAVIPPGVFCEIIVVSGQKLLFPLKDSATGGAFAPNIIGVSMLDEALAVPQLKRARRLGNSGSTRSGLFGPYGGGHS